MNTDTPKQYLSKALQTLSSPWGLLFILFSILALTPSLDALTGKITTSEALKQVFASANGLVHNPISSLIFAFLALFSIGKAAKHVADADLKRGVQSDAAQKAELDQVRQHDAELVESVQESVTRQLSAQLTSMRESSRLNALFARSFQLQDRLNGMSQPIEQATTAIAEYTGAVAQLDAGQIDPRVMNQTIRAKLTGVVDALAVAHPRIAGEPWTDDFQGLPRPEFSKEEAPTGSRLEFRKELNATFLLAHHENGKRLRSILESYQAVVVNLERELSEKRRQISIEADKLGE